MKMKFKTFGKDLGTVAMETGIISAAAVGSAKFLDFETLFKAKIEKDPEFVNQWWIQHQGGVKAGAALLGGAMFWSKLPNWAKLLFIGIGVQGTIQEIGKLTTAEDGTKFFNPIGQRSRGGADTTALEKLLADAAAMGQTNPTTEFPTQVSGAGDTPAIDLTMDASTAVSGMGMTGTGDPDDFGNF